MVCASRRHSGPLTGVWTPYSPHSSVQGKKLCLHAQRGPRTPVQKEACNCLRACTWSLDGDWGKAVELVEGVDVCLFELGVFKRCDSLAVAPSRRQRLHQQRAGRVRDPVLFGDDMGVDDVTFEVATLLGQAQVRVSCRTNARSCAPSQRCAVAPPHGAGG